MRSFWYGAVRIDGARDNACPIISPSSIQTDTTPFVGLDSIFGARLRSLELRDGMPPSN